MSERPGGWPGPVKGLCSALRIPDMLCCAAAVQSNHGGQFGVRSPTIRIHTCESVPEVAPLEVFRRTVKASEALLVRASSGALCMKPRVRLDFLRSVRRAWLSGELRPETERESPTSSIECFDFTGGYVCEKSRGATSCWSHAPSLGVAGSLRSVGVMGRGGVSRSPGSGCIVLRFIPCKVVPAVLPQVSHWSVTLECHIVTECHTGVSR